MMVMVTTILPKPVREFMLTKTTRVPTHATQIPDDDGICDGPNAIAGVCIAGPDITNGPNMITTPVVLVNNSEVSEIAPFMTLSGATYALSPDLPTSMQFRCEQWIDLGHTRHDYVQLDLHHVGERQRN
jgi:hypothetical protein